MVRALHHLPDHVLLLYPRVRDAHGAARRRYHDGGHQNPRPLLHMHLRNGDDYQDYCPRVLLRRDGVPARRLERDGCNHRARLPGQRRRRVHVGGFKPLGAARPAADPCAAAAPGHRARGEHEAASDDTHEQWDRGFQRISDHILSAVHLWSARVGALCWQLLSLRGGGRVPGVPRAARQRKVPPDPVQHVRADAADVGLQRIVRKAVWVGRVRVRAACGRRRLHQPNGLPGGRIPLAGPHSELQQRRAHRCNAFRRLHGRGLGGHHAHLRGCGRAGGRPWEGVQP
mmetsp:Transcript_33171/g.105719  ORF Transcript_33171/g.105719 Transcript_33171/m.105719 type:complete len:286 (+) Transcript_33171:563-1420(+)